MSYILEALKKAQAERQLGATPTIHAPTLDGGHSTAASPLKRPLVLAVGVMGAVIAALLVLVWLQPGQQDAAPPAVAAPSQLAPAPVAAAPPTQAPPTAAAAAAAPAPTAAATAPPPAVLAPAQPASPVPAAKAAEPVQAARPAKSAPSVRARVAAKDGPALPSVPEAAAASAPGAAKAAAAPAEESVPPLRELPEPIQRSIPPIVMGGYMYSKNPADRLLLIDKVLRHEGDEVAPGLVLEKLQPKAAVFSFKGYRYRVPY